VTVVLLHVRFMNFLDYSFCLPWLEGGGGGGGGGENLGGKNGGGGGVG